MARPTTPNGRANFSRPESRPPLSHSLPSPLSATFSLFSASVVVSPPYRFPYPSQPLPTLCALDVAENASFFLSSLSCVLTPPLCLCCPRFPWLSLGCFFVPFSNLSISVFSLSRPYRPLATPRRRPSPLFVLRTPPLPLPLHTLVVPFNISSPPLPFPGVPYEFHEQSSESVRFWQTQINRRRPGPAAFAIPTATAAAPPTARLHLYCASSDSPAVSLSPAHPPVAPTGPTSSSPVPSSPSPSSPSSSRRLADAPVAAAAPVSATLATAAATATTCRPSGTAASRASHRLRLAARCPHIPSSGSQPCSWESRVCFCRAACRPPTATATVRPCASRHTAASRHEPQHARGASPA